MIGAIIGDVIGSVFENENVKTEDFVLFNRFSRFTDDTVLTIAIADAVMRWKSYPLSFVQSWQNTNLYARSLKHYGKRYPQAGYGQMFQEWVKTSSLRGYRSFGNGSAMRVSPIGFAFDRLEDVMQEARQTALPTHNHPQGIQGAQAVAAAIYLARTGHTKNEIQSFVEQRFRYNLRRRLDEIRPNYEFDSSCQGSVPPAIIAFLESNDFEDALRKAISLGGDSDTIACITDGIAQAYYKNIPQALVSQTYRLLDWDFKQIIKEFNERYHVVY